MNGGQHPGAGRGQECCVSWAAGLHSSSGIKTESVAPWSYPCSVYPHEGVEKLSEGWNLQVVTVSCFCVDFKPLTCLCF